MKTSALQGDNRTCRFFLPSRKHCRKSLLSVDYGMARRSEDIEYDVSLLKGKEPSHADFVLGIDIGKNSCSVVGTDDRGAVVLR